MSVAALLDVMPLQMAPRPKSVLNWLAFRADEHCRSWPSQRDIMVATCLGERTVQRALCALEAGGYITRAGHQARGVVVWQIAHAQGAVCVAPVPPKQGSGPPNQAGRSAKTGLRSATRGGQREGNTGREGEQQTLPLLTIKTEWEKIMQHLKAQDVKLSPEIMAQWETVTQGLTAVQVAAIMASTSPPVRWPSAFTKAREAWEASPAAIAPEIAAQQRAEARAAHALKVAEWVEKWRRLEKERRAQYGDEWWAKHRKALAQGCPSEIRADVALALAAQ